MAESFLIGVDNSDCSRRALEFARRRATLVGAKLVVAYVIEWSPYSFNTPEENAERHKRREEEIAGATAGVVQPAVDSLRGAGLEVDSVVRHGNVAEVLNRLAIEHDITQVVVGRVGESGIKSLLFGSVTSKLVQMATVPVTIVP